MEEWLVDQSRGKFIFIVSEVCPSFEALLITGNLLDPTILPLQIKWEQPSVQACSFAREVFLITTYRFSGQEFNNVIFNVFFKTNFTIRDGYSGLPVQTTSRYGHELGNRQIRVVDGYLRPLR